MAARLNIRTQLVHATRTNTPQSFKVAALNAEADLEDTPKLRHSQTLSLEV